MLYFTHSSIINAPVEVVWKFHERQDILQLLTPPWQPVQVLRREGGLDEGAITEFKLFIGLLPLTWLARHTDFEQYRLFTDVQISGPFESWVHRHEFTAEDGKTRLTDNISYSMPGGDGVEFVSGWLIQLQLEAMFRYRHFITKRECESQ
ncbi:MAG: SRPBCC family protein [Sphaerospermopsis kisseleviana]|uniref:Cyclase/dehydrase n=3 Tax=Sphaerospermopsis TaxID=752201 RepID=A0A480A700_9CYAN|nr:MULTISPECIES: SRPBCC family protein [Sphaerospermopsis]BAZ80088.1 cyclase/dehydrase [Sphaerospermopsis kisseleviana NIES-73]MBD2134839.1 cyclase [Sphaerospermopsis sp. FACHB-1094]MBD2145506.1 cyclase [Sphaerospermopsis sp. FACHB-1194]MBE9237216.1 cyclase [Sphaerospermopsis aphanizomenoides LEGE 00250]MDB9442285.1 SRPBCC family protein [Sphaerospermopsis kisseleviana CS-549]